MSRWDDPRVTTGGILLIVVGTLVFLWIGYKTMGG